MNSRLARLASLLLLPGLGLLASCRDSPVHAAGEAGKEPTHPNQIVFSAAADHSGIHVVNADGTGLTNLGAAGLYPTWSPDGRRIAYSVNGGIHVMNADGTDQVRLTYPRPLGGVSGDGAASWSPDGKQLVFGSRRAEAGLHLVNADGSGLRPLPAVGAGFLALPAWAPDGQTIAYQARVEGKTWIYLIRPNGSDNRQLVEGADVTWSPDSRQIAFSRVRLENGVTSYSLHRSNSDGSGVTHVTNDPAVSDRGPDWSPDGTRLVFERGQRGMSRIFVVSVDGSNAHPVTSGERLDFYPSWRPRLK